MTNSLIKAASPEDLVRMLREAESAFQSDAEELRNGWQDPQAGAIWVYAARFLAEAADAIESQWRRT